MLLDIHGLRRPVKDLGWGVGSRSFPEFHPRAKKPRREAGPARMRHGHGRHGPAARGRGLDVLCLPCLLVPQVPGQGAWTYSR